MPNAKPDPLDKYNRKRNFQQTPEPPGKPEQGTGEALRFVIQEHHARRLHYDFRLELDGVLKSWAVPKGPSLNPEEKRLAVQTEDHPLEYLDFQGEIPKGEYGAGRVTIWDEGRYHAAGAQGVEATQQAIRRGLERGRLEIVLAGHKLQGTFYLVKMHDQEANNWLLIKAEDAYASQADVLELGEQLAYRPGRRSGRSTGAGAEAPSLDFGSLEREGARPARMPHDLEPMQATLTEEPFDREGWIFEIKWDGFRAIAETGQETVRLFSRHNLSFEKEFPPLLTDLEEFGFEAVLDGEVVVVDEQGKSSFRLLQHYRKTGEGRLVYYVFDLLYLQGYDLRRMPLFRRKEILRQILPDLPLVKYSDHVETYGLALYRQALEHDVEGIVAKDANSLYRTGVRSKEWLKIKSRLRQEAVIAGYTEPQGSRTNLGALLLGVYEGNELVYVGHTGSGFTEADLAEIKAYLDEFKRKKSPFKHTPKTNAPATWVEPKVVCEVQFAEWTNDGLMRQAIFMGLREDKDPRQVRRERPISTSKALERKQLFKREVPKEVMQIDGRRLAVSNLDKLYWPKEGIAKRDLIDYYRAMAEVLLPYLVDRPLALHRFPNGIEGRRFYQKDVDYAPEWVKRVQIGPSAEETEDPVDYLICQDEATLIYIGNLGTLELNPWNSRLGSLDKPDYLVIDLDPDRSPFEDVIRTAQVFHEILEEIQVENLVKSSGQTGLHIFIPLEARYTYEQTRQFSNLIVQLVHGILPDLTTLERDPKKRAGKVYLDYLQNRKGQTMVAPYSPRPAPGAPVSTPLLWEEVRPGLSPLDFTLTNIQARVDRLGDLWQGVLGPGIDMQASLAALQSSWNRLRTTI